MKHKNKKTAGKTAPIIPSIPSYRRGQLTKFGIKDSRNMIRVLNPDAYPFSFNNEECTVEVSPAKEVLPMDAYEKLQAFTRKFRIVKGMCHIAAYKVANLLREYGVLYCDGYYWVQGDDRMFCHSFCKYRDKYFDPTYEFGLGWGGKTIELYYSSRTYDPREIIIYFATATLMTTGLSGELVITPSTIDYEADLLDSTYPIHFIIDDGGFLQWIDNPYYSSYS